SGASSAMKKTKLHRTDARPPWLSQTARASGRKVVPLDVLDQSTVDREPRCEPCDRGRHHLEPAVAVVEEARHDLILEQSIQLLRVGVVGDALDRPADLAFVGLGPPTVEHRE